ncbi:hypothetical protein BGZ98_001013 [Dissophora globulifera]|nr:hypothetical protein BGZ98_001013 [Dissophora globulifera]
MGVLGLYSYFDSKSLGQRRNWTSAVSPSHTSSTTTPEPHSIPSHDIAHHDSLSSPPREEPPQPAQRRRFFILDGNAYIHHIYCGHLEWISGGQYSSFVLLLTAHIQALQSCGFSLKILFDGPLPMQKLRTRLNRDTEKIRKITKVVGDLDHYRVLGAGGGSAGVGSDALKSGGGRSSSQFLIPPLVMEVTLQTLRSLGVDLMVCDGEADGLVAQLAMEKSLEESVDEAYAVSKDSDYFIYNTGSSAKGGYIPLDSLFVSRNPTSLATTITATVYSQSAIADHLGIQPQFLPLFASLTGNDYIGPELFEHQIAHSLAAAMGQKPSAQSNTNHARIRATASFLKQCGAGSESETKNQAMGSSTSRSVLKVMQQILDDRWQLYPTEDDEKTKEIRSALEESMEQYSPSASLVDSLSSSSLDAGLAGLSKMREAFRCGQFSFKLMDVVCHRMFWCTPFLEDTSRESAWLVSREMRRWIYGILAQRLLNGSETGIKKQDSDGGNDDDDESLLEVAEYVRRGDHLSAEIVTAASRLELDEVLKSARAKAARQSARRVSVMDVDLVDTQTPSSYDLDKAETMSIDTNLDEDDNDDKDDNNNVSNNSNDQSSVNGSRNQQMQDILDLDEDSRTSLFLGILGADTRQVRALPKPFMVLAATLRYLINALAHSKSRSASAPIANFEVIAFVASALFLKERYLPEKDLTSPWSTATASSVHLQNADIPSSQPLAPAVTLTPLSLSLSGSGSGSGSNSVDEAPPLTKRSLHLSTQYQHVLSTVSLLANALHLDDFLPPLASLFDGLLFQQTLALARGGTLLEHRMQQADSVTMYHRSLAAVEEDFIDTGEIDVVVVFRAPSGKKANHHQQQHQEQRFPLGIFGPDMEPVNQIVPAQAPSGVTLSSGTGSGPLLKAGKSAGIQKKSSGSGKKRGGTSTGSSQTSHGSRNGNRGGGSGAGTGGAGGGSSGANMFNVLALGCEF